LYFKIKTVPVYVAALYNINNTVQQWPTIMTAAVLTTIPLIVYFSSHNVLSSKA
jgi:multiple sugar transport system permease protein/sn-glycerol 3-phosphate transport system permease protein